MELFQFGLGPYTCNIALILFLKCDVTKNRISPPLVTLRRPPPPLNVWRNLWMAPYLWFVDVDIHAIFPSSAYQSVDYILWLFLSSSFKLEFIRILHERYVMYRKQYLHFMPTKFITIHLTSISFRSVIIVTSLPFWYSLGMIYEDVEKELQHISCWRLSQNTSSCEDEHVLGEVWNSLQQSFDVLCIKASLVLLYDRTANRSTSLLPLPQGCLSIMHRMLLTDLKLSPWHTIPRFLTSQALMTWYHVMRLQ